MDKAQIEDKIRAIIVKLFERPAEQVSLETRLRDDLQADSMLTMELVVGLEEAFDLQLPTTTNNPFQNIQTVGDIVSYIDGRLSGANP